MPPFTSRTYWIDKFRRETASTRYLPEVDGLRFIAVFWVVTLMHTTNFINVKIFEGRWIQPGYWPKFIKEGLQGMALFFIISGFILSLPFAKAYLENKPAPGLKRYYINRLIRLEPPYIIALVLFFIANVFVLHKYTFAELLPHFFASLVYMHNYIYGGFSLVLPVAWSLEVEVQFYILAPLFCLIYRIQSRQVRWTIFIVAILAGTIYWYNKWVIGHVFKFSYFFFTGMFLTDLYCCKVKIVRSERLCFWIGIMSLIVILFLPSLYSFPAYLLKILLMGTLFYIVLTNNRMKQVFSNKVLTIIGGMCYSIYLLHFGVLSCLAILLERTGVVSENASYLLFYFLLFTAAVLLVSAIYFLLVEKPFMKMRNKKVHR